MSDVNINIPPQLIDKARAAQYLNRNTLGERELDKKIKRRVKAKAKKKIEDEKIPTEKKLGGQLEHTIKISYKIWTKRRRPGGGGFLLIPDKAPVGEFIELVTEGDYDRAAFGNNGLPFFERRVGETGYEISFLPSFDYINGKLFATLAGSSFFHRATTELNMSALAAGGDGRKIPLKAWSAYSGNAKAEPDTIILRNGVMTGDYLGFYENLRSDPNSGGLVAANTLNIFYPNSDYQTCTFEAIVSLGSTPQGNNNKPTILGFGYGSTEVDDNLLQDIGFEVTIDSGSDVIIKASHGFSNGTKVSFYGIGQGSNFNGLALIGEGNISTGIVIGAFYYVSSATASNFKISDSNGTPISIEANATAIVVKADRYVISYPGEMVYNPDNTFKEFKVTNPNSESIKQLAEQELTWPYTTKYTSVIGLDLGGFIFTFSFNSFISTVWSFSCNASVEVLAAIINSANNFYLEIENFSQANKEHHIVVQYQKESVFIFLNGTLILSGGVSSVNRNKYTHITFASGGSARYDHKIDAIGNPEPVYGLTRWFDPLQSAISGKRYYFTSPQPNDGIIGYQQQYGPEGETKTSTSEMRTGFHSLRFTPGEALYTAPFTPPTRITELAG